MTSTHHVSRASVWSCLVVLAIPTAGFAQRGAIGGLLTNPPVVGVPLSAIATTTVRQTLKDGSRVERTGIARYYRDRMGRVRVEQTFRGNQALNSADGGVRITIYARPSHPNG